MFKYSHPAVLQRTFLYVSPRAGGEDSVAPTEKGKKLFVRSTKPLSGVTTFPTAARGSRDCPSSDSGPSVVTSDSNFHHSDGCESFPFCDPWRPSPVSAELSG